MTAVRHVWIGADCPLTPAGGLRRHMLLHGRGLRDLGVRTTLAFSDSCATTRIPGVDSRIPGARLLAGALRSLQRDPPDVINVHSLCAPAFILARRAGLLAGRVVVMSYAADERGLSLSPQSAARRALRFLRAHVPPRLTMRSASGVWCVSRVDANYYVDRYGVRRDRVKYIPHAIEPAFFERLEVPRRPTQLAFVGTWILRKGIDVLAGAMAEIARARPDVTLVVAGTLGSEDDVRSTMRDLPADRLRVVPQLDDRALRALYHESAILLVPSRLEGMPFAMLEAMACGCPTLAATNSGMIDAIAEGENGWLIDTFEPGAWASRLIDLLSTPERLNEASVSARRHAEGFRLGSLSRTTLDWYDSLPV
jgi:glycosyltransferase involved in cell wall biosynthesis